jgi:hypothetical protein
MNSGAHVVLVGISAVCAIASLSCDDSGSHGVAKPVAIERLEEQANFELLWPAQLPANISSMPSTEFVSEENEARVTYYGTDNDDGGMSIVVISQTHDPESAVCPPCVGTDAIPLETLLVDHVPMYLRETQSAADAVSLSVYFRQGDVRVAMFFDWRVGQNAPKEVTETMREQALVVVKSTLEA